jgi:predicted permease
VNGILADLRHALRIYRRTPIASGLAVVVLAIAMAFVGAFLSMYVDFVLKPHPGFEQSGRIVTLGQNDGTRLTGLPYALIERIDSEMPEIETIVGAQTRTQLGGEPPQLVATEFVTRGFTSGLKPRIQLGRGFEDAEHDPEAERVVIVSHRYWQDTLGGDPAVLDTTIELTLQPSFRNVVDGRPEMPAPETADYRIVGVMAAEMQGLGNDRVAYWLPFERAAVALYGELQRIRGLNFTSYGRAAAGVPASSIAEQLNARYLDETEQFRLQPGFRLDAIRGLVRNMNQQRDLERQLRLFLVGSLLLALVAAANVSLFLLARAPGRRRELGIRLAVGAPVRRLARQLASEAGLLVVVAALIGLAGSVWLAGFLRGLAFLRQTAFREVTLFDWRVLSLVFAFLAIVTLLVSLAPVLGLRRLGIAASSRQVAARASLAQRIAGASQIAIAGTMAGAAVAFGWYLGVMIFGYPGYETRDLHVVNATPASLTRAFSGSDGVSSEVIVVEMARLKEALESVPGISAVSVSNPIPGTSTGSSRFGFPHPSDPTRLLQLQVGAIDDSFVEMLRMRLASGRVPRADETGVVLVNRAAAHAIWGRDDVVGESLPIFLGSGSGQRSEIVGVMEDVPYGHPAADPEPMVFATGSSNFLFNTTLLIQSPLPTAELQQLLQRTADEGTIEMSLAGVRSLRAARGQLIAPDRARGFLTIGTALLVVLIAAFGFYGTQRYLVTAGRREYAIRASIGAGPRALGRLVIQRGLMLGLPGLVIGSFLAFITVAWLRDDFISRDVSAFAVTVVVVAGLVLLLVAASFGPSRQAMRTQPAPLLREE